MRSEPRVIEIKIRKSEEGGDSSNMRAGEEAVFKGFNYMQRALLTPVIGWISVKEMKSVSDLEVMMENTSEDITGLYWDCRVLELTNEGFPIGYVAKKFIPFCNVPWRCLWDCSFCFWAKGSYSVRNCPDIPISRDEFKLGGYVNL